MDAGAESYIARLEGMDAAAEEAALNAILTTGYDQGCFLRPEAGDLIPNTPDATAAVLEALQARAIEVEATEADPFQNARPPAVAIPEMSPGYVVLTQGCDLIRSFRAEPFIELARVTLEERTSILQPARSNSPRFLLLADGPDKSGWVIDLRHQARLAKDQLSKYSLVQAIGDDNGYKRFKMRVGNRYSRDALPTDLVEAVQRPLRRVIRDKPALTKASGVFSDLLVFRREGLILISAVYGPGGNRKQAEDAWDAVEAALPEEVRALVHEDSGAISIEDVRWWDYIRGWKMDLDEVSYGKKAATHAKPAQTGSSTHGISSK